MVLALGLMAWEQTAIAEGISCMEATQVGKLERFGSGDGALIGIRRKPSGQICVREKREQIK